MVEDAREMSEVMFANAAESWVLTFMLVIVAFEPSKVVALSKEIFARVEKRSVDVA